ncbi:hypothetical protein D1007_15634 [Hordeum vulgare]|nr:hypothetical protein D1007_15634 [Hordeum vulgare]
MHMLTSVASRHAPRISFLLPFHKYIHIIGFDILLYASRGKGDYAEAAMDEGMELKGCVCRIKSCAGQLLSMEEDLVTDLDDDSWDLVWRDLRLKATFLYIDLSRVISRSENDERRKALTLLANKFFYCTDEVIACCLPP